MVITSLQNPRVKHVLALRERKQRRRDGLMLVEGHDELRLALACGVKPLSVFTCAGLHHATDNDGLRALVLAAGVELVETSRPVFEKMAYRQNPDGWLAVVQQPQLELPDLSLGPEPVLMVIEAVEKPGNLGAILRSADAAGANAVVLCDPTIDIGNPNVVRASRGTVFSVPIVATTSERALAWLNAQAIRVAVATPEARLLHTEADLRGPLAIVVGAERQGVSQVWRQAGQLSIRIPMQGRVNSLNVAQAATVILFEAVRQRSQG